MSLVYHQNLTDKLVEFRDAQAALVAQAGFSAPFYKEAFNASVGALIKHNDQQPPNNRIRCTIQGIDEDMQVEMSLYCADNTPDSVAGLIRMHIGTPIGVYINVSTMLKPREQREANGMMKVYQTYLQTLPSDQFHVLDESDIECWARLVQPVDDDFNKIVGLMPSLFDAAAQHLSLKVAKSDSTEFMREASVDGNTLILNVV